MTEFSVMLESATTTSLVLSGLYRSAIASPGWYAGETDNANFATP
jgi:hypothetical protein